MFIFFCKIIQPTDGLCGIDLALGAFDTYSVLAQGSSGILGLREIEEIAQEILSRFEWVGFLEERHPSQTHDHVEAAEPVADDLRGELAARGIAAEVSVARYLDGRTVLDVLLPEWPLAGQWPDDLSFFYGYEAHVCTQPPGEQRAA